MNSRALSGLYEWFEDRELRAELRKLPEVVLISGAVFMLALKLVTLVVGVVGVVIGAFSLVCKARWR